MVICLMQKKQAFGFEDKWMAMKHLIKSIKPQKLIQGGPMRKMSIFQKLYANCFDLKNIMKCYTSS